MIAEASSTTLLILSLAAAFRDEFIDKGSARLYVFADDPLGAFDPSFHGCDPQFVIVKLQDDLIARLDPQRLTKGDWDYNTAVLIDPQPGFGMHTQHLIAGDISVQKCHFSCNMTLIV
jgi:hypothetical protein